MQTASNCPKHLKLLVILSLIFLSSKAFPQNVSLRNAFAHNDYWHKRPLYDALDNGYTHVEADIYLRRNKLIVAHVLPILRRHKNLEDLYLRPLYECITGVSKKISCPAYPVTLMIDIKSDAGRTYAALNLLLQKYHSIISGYENGVYVQRQLVIVVTGHKPDELVQCNDDRLAFLDQDLTRSNRDTASRNIYLTASCRYSKMLHWNGEGPIPENEQQRLRSFVQMAHRYGKKVRLWASPENRAVWRELLNCGVDLINTDKLAELRNFLLEDKRQEPVEAKILTAGL